MRNKLSNLMKNQSGQGPLALVLILLVVGALIVGPLLALMATGLKAGQMHESRLQGLYAADSGVEGALWRIQYDEVFQLPAQGGDEQWPLPEPVNDMTVNVTVSNEDGQGYKVTSIATSVGGDTTKIEAYLSLLDLSWLLDNAITSPGDITIKPGTHVIGNVQYNGILDNKGNITGEEITDPVDWPTGPAAHQVRTFYWLQVDDLNPVPDGYYIDISTGPGGDPYPIGPLYAEGDLTITGAGLARLDGTVYVKGDLVVMPMGTINLNGQTIYAEGSITFQPQCIICGSGCIIAEGFVDFQPIMGSSPDDFVFIMSTQSPVMFKPNGDFYGSTAGAVEAYIHPEFKLTWHPCEDELNLPSPEKPCVSITSWQIK